MSFMTVSVIEYVRTVYPVVSILSLMSNVRFVTRTDTAKFRLFTRFMLTTRS